MVGKIGTLVAILVGLVTLANRMSEPSADLQANIERGNFYLPPRYSDFADSVEATLSPENIESTLKKVLNDAGGPRSAADEDFHPLTFAISRELNEQIGIRKLFYDRGYRQYWHASVANTGNLPVKEATLRLPGATVAVIDREDKSRTLDDVGPTVEIGNIAAGERVQITAWSDDLISTFSSESSKPTLFHADGPGSVKITNEKTLLDVLFKNFFLFVVILLFALAAYFFALSITLKRAKSKVEEPLS